MCAAETSCRHLCFFNEVFPLTPGSLDAAVGRHSGALLSPVAFSSAVIPALFQVPDPASCFHHERDTVTQPGTGALQGGC